MLELTLVRHGTTSFNQTHRLQGQRDVPLDTDGRREARRLGFLLRREQFDLVVSSDLRRCVETLAIALPASSPRLDPRLREIGFGAWEGRTWEECQAIDADGTNAWLAAPEETVPPDGESFSAFGARLDQVLGELPTTGRVLLVTHGGPIHWFATRLLGLTWRQAANLELARCGICRFGISAEGNVLRCWNETTHLAPRIRGRETGR